MVVDTFSRGRPISRPPAHLLLALNAGSLFRIATALLAIERIVRTVRGPHKQPWASGPATVRRPVRRPCGERVDRPHAIALATLSLRA